MANLVVTFSRKSEGAPLDNAHARTENVAIGATNQRTATFARSGENVVTLLAEANCWYSINDGASSDATDTTAGANRRPLLINQRAQHYIGSGSTVAVVQKV